MFEHIKENYIPTPICDVSEIDMTLSITQMHVLATILTLDGLERKNGCLV